MHHLEGDRRAAPKMEQRKPALAMEADIKQRVIGQDEAVGNQQGAPPFARDLKDETPNRLVRLSRPDRR